MKNILLIVGNGLSIDLHKNYAKELDPSKPMNWDFKIDQDPTPISWQDAFPTLYTYFKKNTALFHGDQFKIFEKIRLKENLKIQVEARHFLALAYTHFTASAYIPRIWKWSKFIRKINSKIHSVISFNYDSSIEEIIMTGGGVKYYRQICSLNCHVDNAITIFKPHGCRTMDVNPFIMNIGPVRYPLRNWIAENNIPAITLPIDMQNKPRRQSFCVLPYEENRHLKHQWQEKLWETMKDDYKGIKNCIIIGHSYGEVDRNEINSILEALPRDVMVHLCDPNPSIDLQKKLKMENLNYKIHSDKLKTPFANDFL